MPEAKKKEASGDGGGGEPLQDAYDLLTEAVERLTRERDKPAVRDSDVKRKMLDRDRSFDEAELGFSKFSRFLQQADEHDVIVLRQRESGNYEVGLPGAAAEPGQTRDPQEGPSGQEDEKETRSVTADASARRATEEAPEPESPATPTETPDEEPAPSTPSRPTGMGRGFRTGEKSGRRKGKGADGPPILQGQIVGGTAAGSGDDGGGSPSRAPGDRSGTRSPGGSPEGSGDVIDPDSLGLPTDRTSAIRYLANSYRGVGEKTAETLVDELGVDLFEVLQNDPGQIRDLLPANRADQFLDAWKKDFSRRKDRLEETGGPDGGSPGADGSGTDDAGPASGGGSGTASDQGAPVEEDDGDEKPPVGRLGRRGGRRTRR